MEGEQVKCSHEPVLVCDASGEPAFYRCRCGVWTWTLEAMVEIIRQFREG